MVSYFKQLLATLISIDERLAKICECINEGGRNKPSINTRAWKD